MRFNFYLILIFAAILLPACQNDLKNNLLADKNKNYFDLPAFFNQEIERLSEKRTLYAFHKEVNYNAKKDKSKVIISDWKRELSLFSRVDLNRKEFLGKYSQQDFQDKSTGKLIQTRYTANDSSLTTKAVDVFYRNEQPQSIAIINNLHNGLFSQQQYLFYQKNELMEIFQLQKTHFWAENSYKIQLFLK